MAETEKSQTPQPGIEPGTPANAADALPLSHGDKRHHQPGFDSRLERLRFFPFLPKLHFQVPFPLSLPISFPSSSFPFLFLYLRPFVCASKSKHEGNSGKNCFGRYISCHDSSGPVHGNTLHTKNERTQFMYKHLTKLAR